MGWRDYPTERKAYLWIQETKRKIAETEKGTHQTEEHIRKRAEAIKKPIIGINKETGFTVEFDSATDAERVLGISSTGITKCCRGKRQSTGGWRFEYKIQPLQ